jgi:hypothetical protein
LIRKSYLFYKGINKNIGGEKDKMGVTITGKKIVLELSKEEFKVLEPEVIEREVLNDLRKLKATKDFSFGKISEKDEGKHKEGDR